MKFAYVNFDYENQLYALNSSNPPQEIFNKSSHGEYLFFFINQDPNLGLAAEKKYSDERLHYLHQLGLKIPTISTTHQGEYWFGKLSDIELERKLNSKIEALKLKSLHQPQETQHSHIINTPEDFKNINFSVSQKWILRPIYGRGGNHILVFNQNEIPEILPRTYVLQPFLNKIIDLAVHYDPFSKEIYHYTSIISPNGKYSGGRVFENELNQWDFLKSKNLDKAYKSSLEQSLFYLEILKKNNLKQHVTIDSFIYSDEKNELQHYTMNEINYRYSMGALLKSLKRFLPKNGVGEIRIVLDKMVENWDDFYPYDHKTKTGVILLNTHHKDLRVIFISAKDMNWINKLKLYFS